MSPGFTAVTVTFVGHVIVGAIGSTVVVVIAVLLVGFGSFIVLAVITVFVITAPDSTPLLTCTTTSKTAVSPIPTIAFEKITLPVPPTAGDMIVHPIPLVTIADTNVVFAGTASVTVVSIPGPGPLFVKLIV